MLLFGLPSVLIALAGGEVWPFLDYRMYAETKVSPTIEWLELIGQTQGETQFPLTDARYFAPFEPSDLLTALYTVEGLHQTASTRAQGVLRDLLAVYEKRRHAGKHTGPALKSLDVYRIQWTAQPGLPNYHQPDSQTLLHSVSQTSVSQ